MPYINHLDDIAFVHSSSPHQHAALERGGIINVPTGKVLGGSSITNGLVYNRGSPYDYDNWANMTNDPSWSYANLLPIFREVEKYEGEFPIGDQHGTNGPLTISKQEYAPGVDVWFESGRELGYERRDPNGPQMVSFCPIEFNTKFGRRESVFDVYLKPLVGNRPNLTIRRHSEAQEIILDPLNIRAIGVLYTRHGKQNQFVMANKEVIVSAGVFGSPKLLLKSGIGPRAHLEEAKITPRIDLPVGRNLQDHPGISIQGRVNTSALPHLFFPERDFSVDSIAQFEENGAGPLTFAAQGAIAEAFIASSRAVDTGYPGWPDLQLALQSHFAGGEYGNPSTYVISNHIFNGRPNSRGYLQLNVTNPSGPVDFGLGFFTDADNSDIKVMVEGIKLAIEMFENTTAYGRLGAYVEKTNIPGCSSQEWGSDAYWECYIKQKASGYYHPVGSCPMGRGAGDPTAVVDSKLRVIGLNGLRVVDASIMPMITNSNIQSPTLVIARKAALDIAAAWA
jgi:choline dehydrogenase